MIIFVLSWRGLGISSQIGGPVYFIDLVWCVLAVVLLMITHLIFFKFR